MIKFSRDLNSNKFNGNRVTYSKRKTVGLYNVKILNHYSVSLLIKPWLNLLSRSAEYKY